MHNADRKFSLGLNIVTAGDHEQSYQMLVDGKADAFATDDILLYGLIARHKSQDKFKVTGEYLSYDPYGIMFRKGEPQLTAVVERTSASSVRTATWSRSTTNGSSRACRPASGSTSRSRRSSRKRSRRSTTRRGRVISLLRRPRESGGP
jgi:hypothetical protein